MKHYFILGFLALANIVFGQKAFGPISQAANESDRSSVTQGVFYYESFQNADLGNLPLDWSTNSAGDQGFYQGLAGNAPGQANENAYWPVPRHGIFAMTNDDVCNCDKSEDYLVSKSFPIAHLQSVVLGFDAFLNASANESAQVEITSNGVDWLALDIIPFSNKWQTIEWSIPDSIISDQFQFRFHYDDGGSYGSGLAIDNVYLRVVETSELKLSRTFILEGSDSLSSQFYHKVPKVIAQDLDFHFGALIQVKGEQHLPVEMRVEHSDLITDVSKTLIVSDGEHLLSFARPSGFYPDSLGEYDVEFTFRDPVMDSTYYLSATSSFEITDSLYQRIEHINDGTGISFQRIGQEIGSIFHLQAEDTVQSMWFDLHPATLINSQIQALIYNTDDLSTAIFSSDTILVENKMINTGLRIPVNQAFTDSKYLVVLKRILGTLAISTSSSYTAKNNEVLTKDTGTWKPFPYFPFISLITKEKSCLGDVKGLVNGVSCNGLNDGSIETLTSKIDSSASFVWSNGADTSFIDNLSPGLFTLTVTDSSGCIYVHAFTIEEKDSLSASYNLVPDLCTRGIGEMNIKVQGGWMPFTYMINGDSSAASVSALTQGNYIVAIEDGLGCTFTDTVFVPGSDSISVTYSSTLPSCSSNNGEIEASIIGTAPFQFSWNTGDSTSIISGLSAGIYSLTATDSLGCMTETMIVLNDSAAPSITIEKLHAPLCHRDSTGLIEVSLSGGLSPYSVQWNNGMTSLSLNNLEAGDYEVMVSGMDSCRSFERFKLIDSSHASVFFAEVNGIHCKNENGIVSLNSGFEQLEYHWSNGLNTDFSDTLSARIYNVSATNSFGCISIDSFKVGTIDTITISIDTILFDIDSIGFNSALIKPQILGGTPPYSFEWHSEETSQNITILDTGQVTLTVTDFHGCQSTFSKYISNDPAGVGVLEEPKLSIYPNPSFTGIYQLESSKPIHSCKVYTALGVLYQSYDNLNGNNMIIYLENAPNGLYFVESRLTTGEHRVIQVLKVKK